MVIETADNLAALFAGFDRVTVTRADGTEFKAIFKHGFSEALEVNAKQPYLFCIADQVVDDSVDDAITVTETFEAGRDPVTTNYVIRAIEPGRRTLKMFLGKP